MSDKKDYEVFRIPKKRKGEFRIIEAPSDELKEKQRASLKTLSEYLYVSPFAHAFTGNKNIVTMARGHVAKPYILAFDISDFFPSITLKQMTEELDKNMSYRSRCPKVPKNKGKKAKEIKEIVYNELDLHFCDFGDDKGARLPQGAPGSPFLSNAFMHNFDWFAAKKSYESKIKYSRYADDIVISGDDPDAMWRLFYHCMQPYLNKIGLQINKKKTKFMTAKHRQMVCGLVVNVKLNIPRRWRKRLRAELFQQKDNKGLRKDTKGRNAFMSMVYDKSYEHICDSNEFLECQKVLSV